MNCSIDFIHIPNLYDTTRSFCEGIHRAAQELGLSSRLHYLEDNPLEIVRAIRDSGADLTCSFGKIDLGEHTLSTFTGVPHWTYWLDPAWYAPQSEWISFADRHESTLLQKPFLPHAVDPLDQLNLPKVYDMVLFGSYFDPQESPLKKEAEEILSGRISFFEMASKIDPTMVPALDRTCRAISRLELIKKSSLFFIDLFGHGWETKFANNARVRCHPAVTWKEAIRIMAQSKIVLNTTPQQAFGSHERVFYGLLNGSIVLTHPNSYLEQEFGLGSGVAFDVAQLDNQDVHKGQQAILSRHTWKARVRAIIEGMKQWPLQLHQ